MTTTTIRLPDALKARVAEAARRSGTTAHGFILEAIAEKTATVRSHHSSKVQSHCMLADAGGDGKPVLARRHRTESLLWRPTALTICLPSGRV